MTPKKAFQINFFALLAVMLIFQGCEPQPGAADSAKSAGKSLIQKDSAKKPAQKASVKKSPGQVSSSAQAKKKVPAGKSSETRLTGSQASASKNPGSSSLPSSPSSSKSSGSSSSPSSPSKGSGSSSPLSSPQSSSSSSKSAIKTSSSSSSKKSSAKSDARPSLEIPDVVLLKDSGLNNNVVDLHRFASDDRKLAKDLSFSISGETNEEVVDCYIDFGRYVDCIPKNGRAGFSQLTIQVSDGRLAAADSFIVSVAETPEQLAFSPPGGLISNPPALAPVNHAPSIAPIQDQSAFIGSPFRLQVIASDPDNDPLVISDSTSLFAIAQSGLISFTPASGQRGTYTVSITASDGKASASRVFTLSILPAGQSSDGDGQEADPSESQSPNPNLPETPSNGQAPGSGSPQNPSPLPQNNLPNFPSISAKTATAGQPFTLQLSASDPDGDTLAFTDNTALFAINTATGLISFTPSSSQAGTHLIAVSVFDGKASATRSFTLTIMPQAAQGNSPPVIKNLPLQLASVDNVFSASIEASDSDGDDLAFSDDTPLFDIDTSTGEIDFLPEEQDIGRYAVTITVSDGKSSSSMRFGLLISEAEEPPGAPS